MKKHTQSPYESSKVSYKPSGIEWLGEIPKHWEICKLNKISYFINGYAFESSHFDYSFSIPVIRIGDIQNDKIIYHTCLMTKEQENLKNFMIYRGDIVIALSGATTGKFAVCNSNKKAYINQRVAIIRSDIKILKYYLSTFGFVNYIDMLCNGSAQPNISTKEVGNFKIPLPPLQEQKEIAEFLDSKCEKIQNYIDKKQKLITLLQEKKQALINEAVCGRVACHTADSHCHTEPLGEVSNPTCHTERSEVSHNTESKRDFSHSLKMTKEKQLSMTTAYKPSGIEYLGLIPHHWEAVKVKFTAYVKGRIGFHGLNSNEFRYDEGAYLVTGNDFDNNEVMWDKCRRVSEERFYEDPNIHLQNNDLLITKDGTIGKTAIVNNCPKQATLNSGIFLVRTMKKMCFVKYLFFIINSQYFKEFVNVKTSGSTIKHLYQSDFHDLKIPLPPLQEQKQIANFLDEKCEKINSAIEKTKRQIELIKEYKNTLINEAVCGRIRVN
ncbi:restriction endonuclease subunit S [Campylobacter upsaliensis]|nr:restriction endonuclease subunit S [Campylobacter upsaliensis]